MSRVLVVGGGGREHAIVVALNASSKVEHIFVAPGNGGTALMGGKVENVDVAESKVAAWAEENRMSLVIVGPEAPLVAGVCDDVAARSIPCFGPSKKASIIESSKAWSKEFMNRQGLRTAAFKNFPRADVEAAVKWARAAEFDIVAKASGLAAGKGVLVPPRGDKAAAEAAIRELAAMTDDPATDIILIEERMDGEEISLLSWCDGERCVCMPPAQDHKRAHDGDRGLNTGGMGAYAPTPLISKEQLREAEEMMSRAITGLKNEGLPFIGCLYGGFMLTSKGPSLLEFNARFGDPETQVLLPLLKSDAFEIMLACAQGDLPRARVEYRDAAAATVVVASKGYPKAYKKGLAITGHEEVSDLGAFCYHAGTKLVNNNKMVTSGGRVVAVTATAPDLKSALAAANAGASRVEFEGAFHRGDIGRRCTDAPVKIGVLGSTRGSSLQPVLEAIKNGSLKKAEVVLIVSSKEDAGIIERAKQFGVETTVVKKASKSESRSDYDARLNKALQSAGCELVLLVGWMRILSDDFVASWKGRCFNVHPSLLPLFAGGMDLEVHQAVIEAGHRESGCTVHEVTAEVDGGTVVEQLVCDVLAKDTPEVLKARVQKLEGAALILAIERFASGGAGGRFRPAHVNNLKQTGQTAKGVLTYRMAGVDIDAGEALIERIKPLAAATKIPGSDSIGGFGAVFDMDAAGFGGSDVLLVSGADGVGTKLKMASDAASFLKGAARQNSGCFEENLGVDLVAMCVNDIICSGAQPLYFLDYYASSKLDVDQCSAVVAGVASGCKQSGCALAGGETAEMPGLYAPGDYDLAGFAVGAVRRHDVLPRKDLMSAGDILIALPSNGVHANGFSLVRRALARLDHAAASQQLNSPLPGDARPTLADALMAPTRLYVKPVLAVMKLDGRPLLGLAHITGGGLSENLPRALPPHLCAEVGAFKLPALFTWLRDLCGNLPEKELIRTFNCGVGMVLIVKPGSEKAVLDSLKATGETNAFICGKLTDRTNGPAFKLIGTIQ